MSGPLAIDLFCGLGGWTEGLLAEGYDVVGFDIERHEYAVPENDERADGRKGTNPVAKRGWSQGCAVSLGMEGADKRPSTRLLKYPAQLVVQDVLTLHGSQFRDAALIVASPPCQEYSYMAMPWKLAKAKAAAIRADTSGLMLADLTRLFDACFRIQAQASLAAGRHIPMVVENVRGAIPWVGRARWNFGSFYLWGDVPALMPLTGARKVGAHHLHLGGGNSFQAAAGDTAEKRAAVRYDPRHGERRAQEWRKTAGAPHIRDGEAHTKHLTNPIEHAGIKCGGDWFGDDNPLAMRLHSSKSPARKQASAMIAKIPLPLSRHIAAVYRV